MKPPWSNEVEARIRAEAVNLDEQVTLLPEKMQICARCVMTSARPRISFDIEGVCSACRYAEMKVGLDWDARAVELEALLQKHRRTQGYDVIVPCSGGKDSAAVAWRLKHEHGMNPLCVTWAPFLYTEIGRKNFDAFVQSGFDVVTAHPSGVAHRKLARLALEYYGDPFIPFIFGQLCWPMTVAQRFNIPLVMFGENGDAEYSGNLEAAEKPRYAEADWARVYMKGASVGKLLSLGREIGAFSDREIRALSPFYSLPYTDQMYDHGGSEFHWFGYYRPWHPQENYYLACEQTGFEANDERSEGTSNRYASLDDKLDGWHFWWGWLKFGIGRMTSDAAHEIRDGNLERDEALALVAKYDGEFPVKYHQECLDYLGLSEDHLYTVAERFARGVDWREKISEKLGRAVSRQSAA